METLNFQKPRLTLVVLTALAMAAGNALAQNSPPSTSTTATTAAQPSASQTAPQLSYGVSDVLQLSQAKVGDGTIINYIRNSGNNYGLNAAQIIYLRQQGVSSAVINAMLNQPRMLSGQPASTATASQPAASTIYNTQTSTAVVQPTVTYVQTVPSSSVYIIPDTQTYNYDNWYYSQPPYGYYPYYGYGWPYPGVSVSFGWGGGWGGRWSGYHRGWHGGGYHSGWHHR